MATFKPTFENISQKLAWFDMMVATIMLSKYGHDGGNNYAKQIRHKIILYIAIIWLKISHWLLLSQWLQRSQRMA